MKETKGNGLLDAGQVASELGIRKAHVYKLAREGEFDDFLIKIGEKPLYRWDPRGLQNYLARGGRRASGEGVAEPA